MSGYILITAGDDSPRVIHLTERQLAELLRVPQSTYRVERFLEDFDQEPAYWAAGDAVLLKAEVIVPRPVVTSWTLK